jgi:hypothetical protein
MKLLIKLAIAALIINAVVQVGMVYVNYYHFQDSVKQAALARGQTDEQFRRRIVELAAEDDIPIDGADFNIRRSNRHVYVTGAYETKVPVLPGVQFPLHMTLDVDAYVLNP